MQREQRALEKVLIVLLEAHMACTPAPDDGQPHWPELPHAGVACVLSHIHTTADRKTLRSVCRAWRESADGCWRRAAYVCSWLPDPDARQPKVPATDRFLRCGAFLFPVLRSLDLLELRSSFKLRELLQLLTPARLPHLASLGISCPLLEGWSDGGALQDLPLAAQLRSLRLYGLTVDGGLPALAARFPGLTELVLSAQLDAGTADLPSVDAVSALAGLSRLQVGGGAGRAPPRRAAPPLLRPTCPPAHPPLATMCLRRRR